MVVDVNAMQTEGGNCRSARTSRRNMEMHGNVEIHKDLGWTMYNTHKIDVSKYLEIIRK